LHPQHVLLEHIVIYCQDLQTQQLLVIPAELPAKMNEMVREESYEWQMLEEAE